jgi:WD40 repeat protein
MNVVENVGTKDHWAVQPTYPLWKELPADITCNQVLTLLNPLDHSHCSGVCKQWNRFLISDSVWQPLSRYHFPSITPGFFKSFQAYRHFYSNFSKGVCSVKTLLGHNSGVTSLVLREGVLLSGSRDKTIKIWDLRTNTCIVTLEGHTEGISSLVLRDATLISGSYDKTIKIWDLRTNTCIATLEGDAKVLSLALKEATLFSGCSDATIKIWDLRTNTCTATLSGHTCVDNSLVSKDTTLFSGSTDETIKIWDLKTNTCTATLKGHTREISSLALRDATLFSGSWDKTIKIWNLESNTCTDTLTGHSGSIGSFALRDATLISGSSDHTIKIWDLGSNTCMATLLGHGAVPALALKDATLFSGSLDGTITIRDFAASHAQIFTEIASALEGQKRREAIVDINRFLKMPEAPKKEVFDELYKIIKPNLKHDYLRCAKDAFNGENEQSATNAQRAEAIKNYLSKLPK